MPESADVPEPAYGSQVHSVVSIARRNAAMADSTGTGPEPPDRAATSAATMPEASQPSGAASGARPYPGGASAGTARPSTVRPGAVSQITPPPIAAVLSSPSATPAASKTSMDSSTWSG